MAVFILLLGGVIVIAGVVALFWFWKGD